MKNFLYPVEVDEKWQRDSSLLRRSPRVLFRVTHKGANEYIVPIATIGGPIPRELRMADRGWHAFDQTILYSGKEVVPLREGRPAPSVRMERGMWENLNPTAAMSATPTVANAAAPKPQSQVAPLDTMTGCPAPVPSGKVNLGPDVHFALVNYRFPPGQPTFLSQNEVEQAISAVPNVVAPRAGVSSRELTQFHREVHQIGRVSGAPFILLQYDDPERWPDSASAAGKRPRLVIIILEKGLYGYKPAWIYKTTRLKYDALPIKYLDYLDVNGDGMPEIFFSLDLPGSGIYTIMYRKWNDSWRETWRRSESRCDTP